MVSTSLKRIPNYLFIHLFIYLTIEAKSEQCNQQQENLALASMARDDPPASSTAPLSTVPISSTGAAMRGKVGSEFET